MEYIEITKTQKRATATNTNKTQTLENGSIDKFRNEYNS